MTGKRVVGIGPMWTTSKLYIENDKDYESDVRGTGIRVSLGLEFMITQKIGIGIEGVSQKHIFKKPKGYNVSNDEQYGFLQQGLLFGLRTYL